MAVHSHNFVTTPEHPSFQRCITNASGSVKGCGAVQRISGDCKLRSVARGSAAQCPGSARALYRCLPGKGWPLAFGR